MTLRTVLPIVYTTVYCLLDGHRHFTCNCWEYCNPNPQILGFSSDIRLSKPPRSDNFSTTLGIEYLNNVHR